MVELKPVNAILPSVLGQVAYSSQELVEAVQAYAWRPRGFRSPAITSPWRPKAQKDVPHLHR